MLAGQSSTVALRYIYNLEFLHSVNLYLCGGGGIYPHKDSNTWNHVQKENRLHRPFTPKM